MPYSLSEEQIDFILADIKKRGIEIEKLQINLLDHICCLLEEKMKEGDDLETCYKAIIEDFHENGMKGLQKETKGVLRSRHYYKSKNLLYFIFIVSIGYNIYSISMLSWSIKKFREERMTIANVTIKDGFEHLNSEFIKKYPNVKLKDYTCIYFMEPMLNVRRETYFSDTTLVKLTLCVDELFNVGFDSLASIHAAKVTFICAFESTDEMTEKYMSEQIVSKKNTFFLSGMNKILSGYSNYRKTEYKSYPTIFVLNKTGDLVYDGYFGYDGLNQLSRFLKTLPN
jgi:hypothetical protein